MTRDRFRLATGICLGVLVLAVAWALTSFPDHYRTAQAAMGDDLEALLVEHPSIEDTALHDIAFAAVYGVTGFVCALYLLLHGGARHRTFRAVVGTLATAAVAVGAAADIVENLFLRALVERARDGEAFGLLDQRMRVAGVVRWTALVAALAWVAWTVARPRPPGRAVGKRDPRTRPAWHTGDKAQLWDPPPTGTERIGVCCSGGGIRSASFSLGVLQELEKADVLRRAEYLAAVSGGGYMAAGYEVANRTLPETPPVPPPAPPEPPAYAPGSPEERHFRDNASYLVPSFLKALPGIGTLLAGLVFNLVIVWLVLFAVARPVGWLMGALHPELRAEEPVALVDRATADVQVTYVRSVDTGSRDVHLFEVAVGTVPGKGACMDVHPFDSGSGDHSFGVATETPAVVEVRNNKATVLRQPTVVPSRTDPAADCGRALAPDELLHAMEVERQPTLKLVDTGVADAAATLRSLLKVDRHAQLVPEVGLRGREGITIEGALGGLAVALLVGGIVIAFLKTVLGLHSRVRATATALQYLVGVPGAVLFAVAVALPWLTQELTELYGGLDGTADGTLLGGWRDYLAPGGGIVVLVVSAVRRFLATNQSRPGDAPKPQGGSIVQRVWRRLTGSSETLGWYELSPAKIVAGVVVALVPVFVFLHLLVYAAANGPGGRLMGSAIVRDNLDSRWWPPEWLKFALVVVVLLLLQRLVAAHNWSLHAFYKRRLSDAYLVHRRPGTTDVQVPFDDYPLPFHAGAAEGFPQLILGCAVNLSEPGVVPPARRAASFTFSSTEIGGPVVGYLSAEEYWNGLRKDRQKDITLPAAMAISGAAFSPAMGKFNLGPVGALYAFANLRLGVWLPHPEYVRANEGSTWADRPGWSWYLREIANLYRLDSPYLYVSDGGHWENLGLVELLRRGCTTIVCVNGGGDHQDSFGTIGEAVALAREELGVEIVIDPSPLRPPIAAQAAAAAMTRELRRSGAKGKAEPMAPKSFARGTFTYPNGRQGVLWLIEPALTADMPIDVHVYAEGVAVFPDDSTGDQVFNHEQFEAFHALGAHQTRKVLDDAASVSLLVPSPTPRSRRGSAASR